MFQLKFNDDYIEIIRNISYWKSQVDIPQHIVSYIKNTSDNRVA